MKENSQQLQQDIKHDRQMIESSFDSNKLFTPKEMKERFGRFGAIVCNYIPNAELQKRYDDVSCQWSAGRMWFRGCGF